jgi:hypothetical protein
MAPAPGMVAPSPSTLSTHAMPLLAAGTQVPQQSLLLVLVHGAGPGYFFIIVDNHVRHKLLILY